MDDFLKIDSLLQAEEKILRDSLREWVNAKVVPIINDAYENAYFPQQLILDLVELGLLGMALPEQYGGSQANAVSYGLACQELERGDSAIRSFVSVQNSLCMFPIFQFGSEEQKQRFLPKMTRGEIIGCFGLTEPDAGSDPNSMRTIAKQTKGGWLISGSKLWITNATLADIAIIWAKTEQGIKGFIVEAGSKGYQAKEIHHKMSLRASATGEIVLDECFVPTESYLPGTDIGLAAALKCLTQARYGIAWGAIGAAMACYDIAVSYAKERIQFNKPIASNQLIQKDLVLMFTEILKAQLLNLQVGRLKDQNLADYNMVSLIKLNACRQALQIARMARNILGANGISLEYSVIRHMMNLETVYTYEGTENIHTLILGKHITGLNAF